MLKKSLNECIFFVINMINVGFIEEIIFRGFLFKMMEKESVLIAIYVTSITFGIGHFINLLMGAEFVSTLFQMISGISIGYLFAIIFYKTKSLIPCIVTHSLLNALSVFYVETNLSLFINIFLIIIPFIYARYIYKTKRFF